MPAAPPLSDPTLRELVRRLDEAMVRHDDALRCREVQRVLQETLVSGAQFLDPGLLVPDPEGYTRRLVHRDPGGRYTVLALAWAAGQGTPLHDHGGIWCVEGVYAGRIRVTTYSCQGGDPEHDLVRFRKESVTYAGVGEAGALIPPFEYHLLENAGAGPAATLHVYGGELDHCHVFEPAGNLWLRRYHEPAYTA